MSVNMFCRVGHWDPFSFLPLLALGIAVIVLSSGQTRIRNPTNLHPGTFYIWSTCL